MSCKCANRFLAVLISWLPMGEQIVGTTKTSVSLDDSLFMFPTLTLTFSHSVGWLVTSCPKVFIKSDSVPVDGKINWSRACCVM